MTKHNDAPTVAAPLSTITPAEVGGLVERLREQLDHVELGIACRYPDVSGATTELIRVATEVATALEAQAAELEAVKADRDDWIDRCRASVMAFDEQKTRAERAEAQLAEARKALEPFAAVAEHDIGDDETDDDIFWPISNARYSMSGRLRVGHLRAARRALEAQGGQNG